MSEPLTNDQLLTHIQQHTFQYFLNEGNLTNGLIKDKTADPWPASITAIGLALTAYPVGVECGKMRRDDAIGRTLATLRFFRQSEQGTHPNATGYQGFYYHFLEMDTGRRAWSSELSTVDTAFLIAGMLTAAAYFDRDTGDEREIRDLADELYRRVDWDWARNRGALLTHGWKPEKGFLRYHWEGYDEGLLLYILALGSPTHPVPAASYQRWGATYSWTKAYDQEYLYSGPLFTHQLSQTWIDCRGIQDAFVKAKGIDYFENSRRATYVHQKYAIDNPGGWDGYGETIWGFTASDGPGPVTRQIAGKTRKFYDYIGRGAPYGPDDGCIAPWAVVASLPFAPEIVLPTIEHFEHLRLRVDNPYGFKSTYNPTFKTRASRTHGWISPYHFGLDQGPIVLMIENYRNGFVWELTRGCSYFAQGLRKNELHGGWLDQT